MSRVSAEEKRARLLELLYEKKEFFQLKDLERIAPREKGIVVGSVKETLQYLVDNGFVKTDKIGLSVYYWAFPSEAVNSRKRNVEELTREIVEAKKKLKTEDENGAKSLGKSGDEKKRDELLEQIMDLEIERDELLNTVKKYRENDPKVLEMKRERIKAMRDAANRWTDNTFCIRSWVKNKFNMEEAALNKHFGIPSDFDYIN